jgi:hypothetical protein
MNQSFDRSFLRNLWRRWPITIVTTTLAVPIASWAYLHMSDASRPTFRAYAAVRAAKPSGALPEVSPHRTQMVAKVKRALPEFRRIQVGTNEVDYVAEDVTVRIFTPLRNPRAVASGSHHVQLGDAGTMGYFADDRAAKAER